MNSLQSQNPKSNLVERIRQHTAAGDRLWFALHAGEQTRDRLAIPDECRGGLPERPYYRVEVELLLDGRLLRTFYPQVSEGANV